MAMTQQEYINEQRAMAQGTLRPYNSDIEAQKAAAASATPTLASLYPTYDDYQTARGYTYEEGWGDDAGGWRLTSSKSQALDYDNPWDQRGNGAQSEPQYSPEEQAIIDRYELFGDTKYGSLMSQLARDSTLAQYLGGTAGYVRPQGQGYWGMGGARSTGMSLEDMLSSDPNAEEGQGFNFAKATPEEQAKRWTPQQAADRADFERLYPGMAQVTPDVMMQGPDGQWGFKRAGPSVGTYLENPNDLKYDPRFGYITGEGNQGVAGGKGGSRGLWSLAAMVAAPWAAPLIGAATGLGAIGGGAIYGGGTAALGGGNIAKGALMGGLGGALSGIGAGDAAGGSFGGDFAGTTNAFETGASLGDLYASGAIGASAGDYLHAINTSSELTSAKDIYGMYKKGTGAVNTLKRLFGDNDSGPKSYAGLGYTDIGGKIQTPGATLEELSQLYGSNFGSNSGYWDRGYKERGKKQPAFGRS